MKTVSFYHTVKIQVVSQGYGQFRPDSDKEYDTFRDIVIDSSRELDRISPFMWGAHDIEWGECQRSTETTISSIRLIRSTISMEN